ncbi:hypothetical protein [Klebsiella quasipneumoniae]|uniref:hypothetical protein n=1 Tax=Klebsiella quasipneumoniae TaxID=1463165 RepID=UPI00296FE85D|nr:hypothetical protein [Klebsiella quasipneumoniae]
MANYFDSSHIDGKQLTPQQIADAIRHKSLALMFVSHGTGLGVLYDTSSQGG